MSPKTKKKVDQGIDTIFEKIELTTAKDFEKLGAGSGQQSYADGIGSFAIVVTPEFSITNRHE